MSFSDCHFLQVSRKLSKTGRKSAPTYDFAEEEREVRAELRHSLLMTSCADLRHLGYWHFFAFLLVLIRF